MKILIVDDSKIDRKLFERIVESPIVVFPIQEEIKDEFILEPQKIDHSYYDYLKEPSWKEKQRRLPKFLR